MRPKARSRARDRASDYTTRGLGVDALGGPVIDPTENVKALMEASITSLSEQSELRALLLDEKIRRIERECDHLQHVAEIRERHAGELRDGEAKRLDAIRATDAGAVATTAAQSLAAVQALSTTQQVAAETLRNQVSTTATTIANQTDRIVSPIMERLAALEKIVNIGQGRSTVADPQISELMTEMRKLSSSRDLGTGKSAGISTAWGILLGVAALIASLLLISARMSPSATAAPQVIYVPSPPGTLLPSSPPATVPR